MIIAVDGPMASGKSTLARVLGQRYGLPIVLEDSTDVHISKEFHRDPERYALATELALVQLHAAQLERASRSLAVLVTDVSLQRDLAYARITLGGHPDASATFVREWRRIRETTPKVDLVILLDCPTSELMRRVRMLDRPIEDNSYLSSLSAGIRSAHREFPDGKVVFLDASGAVEEYAIYDEIARVIEFGVSNR